MAQEYKVWTFRPKSTRHCPLRRPPAKPPSPHQKAEPLAQEQATVHAVADALQSRGSAAAANLAGRIPNGSPCDNERTECAQGSAHRLLLVLLNGTDLPRVVILELSPQEPRNLQAGCVRHDALESHSFQRQLQGRREREPRSARRALPHLLAADFCFRLPPRLLSRRRRGSHTGFLCHDSGA